MEDINDFKKRMYQLDINQIDKEISKSKNQEEADFWNSIYNKVLQHRQKKIIREKFVR